MFTLIIVLGFYGSQSGGTTIIHEFHSQERCEAARVDIVTKASANRYTSVTIQGCYKK
jgi:hypothetical protein